MVGPHRIAFKPSLFMRALGTPDIVQTTGKATFLSHANVIRDVADVLVLETAGNAVGLQVGPGGLSELKRALTASGFEIEEQPTLSIGYELKYGRRTEAAPPWIRRFAPFWYIGAAVLGLAVFFLRQRGNPVFHQPELVAFFAVFFGVVAVVNLAAYVRWRRRQGMNRSNASDRHAPLDRKQP
jgi:hypothetical protein